MAHRYSAATIAEAVCAIMMEKIVYNLHSRPNTKTFDHLKDQLAKSCAAVRTTAWKGQHGCLQLALIEFSLASATNSAITSSDPPPPSSIR